MRRRVLIIDDDEQLASAFREYLVTQGLEVDCAQELEEAQTLLEHFSYAVVITDLRLSKWGFRGLELVKWVREMALKTHIVVFSGYGWPELQEEMSAQHVDAFLPKPMPLRDLAETVSQLVGTKA